ncbi:MAG: N-6 DNA methylase [Deltaproteobacteria bacterium]|nr:N-6 DNA methylase [Deltaproteobacteria bacterium]MBM4041242.1 hypothetical protein [Planctomycetota bacterium]
MHLQKRIQRIYDHLYANAAVRTPAGICAEVGKILHAALFMELAKHRSPAFDLPRTESRDILRGENPLQHKWIAVEVREAFKEMNTAWQLYEFQTGISLSDFDISYVSAQLSGVTVSDPERDVLGDALELFRCEWAKRAGGQYFTDQRVTHLAMAMLGFDPRKGEDLVDICAGSGGFLLAGLNHIRQLVESEGMTDRAQVEMRVADLALASIRGQEIDAEVCGIANATISARLGKRCVTCVSQGDSLQRTAFGANHALGLRFDSHTCAASNPPFGTKTTVKDPAILRDFDLAKHNGGSRANWGNNSVHHRAPDLLLLEQNIRLLKPGLGRLAIVLPYQILSGPGMAYVRRWLLARTELLAVVDLPVETFQPHTGTKTCLVVLKRRERALSSLEPSPEREVFMSIPRWIGHDRRGNPVFERTPDGKLSDRILSDFNDVQKAFAVFREGGDPRVAHSRSFRVSQRSILHDPILRMNALFHRPSEHVVVVPGKTKHNGDWRTMKLRELVERIFYPGRFKRNYVEQSEGAVPFLGGADINQLTMKSDKWLGEDEPRLQELKVRTGWILVTRSGSTGIVSSVPKAWDGYAMSEHVIRVVPDPNKLPPEYVFAFLRTRYAQEQLSRGIFGSVIDEINPHLVGELDVPVPKSRATLDEIVKSVRKAERAREFALQGFGHSVECLEKYLGRSEAR